MPKLIPWPYDVLGALFARRIGVEPERLERMALGLEPWDPEILPALAAGLAPTAPADSSLPSGSERTKLPDVTPDNSVRQYGRPIKHGHPFTDALKEARMTVVEWAATSGYGPEQVRSWYRTSDGRAIPRAAAEAIEKQFPAVKATKRTWRWGIKD